MRNRGRVVVAALMVASALSLLSGTKPAAANHFIDFGDGAGSGAFGPNSVVRIDGHLRYETDCREEGIPDLAYPATDVYVVTGGVGDGSELQDVNGQPNTIVSTASVFVGEVIAITAPSGRLGGGTYGLVFDTCQDGFFDGGEDAFFPDVITVMIPAVLPPMSSFAAQVKATAAREQKSWDETHKAMEAIFKLAQRATKTKCKASGGGACLVKKLDLLGKIKKDFLTLLANQSDHYKAIADDPPDPDFATLTRGLAPFAAEDHSDSVVASAAADAVSALEVEAALSEALLRAMERYQGAQVAGDAEWGLIHARQAENLSSTLAGHLPATADALEQLRNHLNAAAAEIDAAYEEARAFTVRVAQSGLTPDERRNLRNLGLTQHDISLVEVDLRVLSRERNLARGLTTEQLIQDLDAIIGAHGQTAVEMADSAAGWRTIAATLQGQASVPDAAPHARAGGPYAATEGMAIALDASLSSAPRGRTLAAFAWDLDGDGGFDDATGPRPSVSFAAAGNRLVSLQVTDSTGRTGIAFVTVNVENTNTPPIVASIQPAAASVTTVAGTTTPFSVASSDPDGDALSYTWWLDGTPLFAITASQFSYHPTAAEVGEHILEVAVADGTAAGGTTRASWTVLVVAPDGDHDGWTATTDCDESDPAVYPGAHERLGNHIDDDCDTGTPDAPPGGLTGSVWSWGSNALGALGTGTPMHNHVIVPTPKEIAGYADLVQVDSSTSRNGYALRADGRMLAWGENFQGALGNADDDHRNVPVSPVAVGGGSGELSGITQFSADSGHVVALRTDGTVVAWGDNGSFQERTGGLLGDGSSVNFRNYPNPVLSAAGGPPVAGVRTVEAGRDQTYALMDDGTVRAWGIVECSGGPDASSAVTSFPTPLPHVGADVRQVASGYHVTLILKKDGTVLSCGGVQNNAILGRTPTPQTPRRLPTPVTGFGPGSGVVAVSAGFAWNMALKADGTVWAWGENQKEHGQLNVLGVPEGTSVSTPRQVPLPTGAPVVAVEADGACYGLVLRADGSVLTWGCNFFGQATVPGGQSVDSPTLVSLPDASAVAVSTGIWNGLALTRPMNDVTWERPATWVEASVDDAMVDETAGRELTARLTATLPHAVTLQWSLAAGSAGPDDVNLAATGTVTVPAGSQTASVPLPVTADALDEEDERFTVVLTDASHGIRLARTQAEVTIVDDDDPPALTIHSATVTEGHTSLTDVQVTAVLSVPSGKPITVAYGTADGTATAPGDYSSSEGVLRFAPGETAVRAHVAVSGDVAPEPNEAFTVTLTSPENASVAAASAPVVIRDDDALALAVTSPVVTEGSSGTTSAAFSVRLDPPVPIGSRVSVPFRLEGLTATLADDVIGTEGTLQFEAGGGAEQVAVSVIADAVPEPDESFRLVLGTPSSSDGRLVLPADAPPAVILNDDVLNRPPDCSEVTPSIRSMWPPNHKLVAVTLRGAQDPDGHSVSLAVTAVAQDEPVDGGGDGSTSPDAQLGPAAHELSLRAERAGDGDGRIYRIAFSGTDALGATCSGRVTVAVPHNDKQPAVDSGRAFNSLAP